jgi:hypothetical protein
VAKIRATETTISKVDQLSLVVSLPEHATNDLIIFGISKDDATGGAFTTPAGWTKGGENTVGASGNNTVRSAWYYKIAASSAEAAPTITSTDTDSWSCVASSIQGVDTVTPIDVSNGNGITDVVGNPYTAASVTTTTANALVLYIIGSDGGVSPVAPPGFITNGLADSAADSTSMAFTVQRTAGATPTCDFNAQGQADESVLFTIAIRDGSSGTILPGYPNLDCATIVRPLTGNALTYSGDAIDSNSDNFTQLAGTWVAPDIVYQVAAVGPVFTDITAAATNATDADVNPVPAVEAVGDYIAIGFSSVFAAMRFDMASCTAGVGGVLVNEYLSTSGAWKLLPEFYDSTSSFTAAAADHRICGWSQSQDWTSQALNAVSKFWLRRRVTTVYTTNPTISQIFVSTSPALNHLTPASRTDAGFLPQINSLNLPTSIGGNLMSGGCYALTAVLDLSTARLMGTHVWDSPAETLDVGKRSDGGVSIGLIDSTNKVKAWCVAASDSLDTYSGKRNNFLIQVNQSTDTSFIGNAPNMTDIKRLLFMTNNKYGAVQTSFNPLINVGTLKISGGGSSAPVTYEELVRVANGYPCPLIDAITNISYVAVQIGGAEAVNCQMAGFALTFPQQALASNRKTEFHSDPGIVGMIFDGRAGDVISISSGKFTSLSPYKFEFLATASASATWSFVDNVVNNALVTLRAVVTFSRFTFSNCTSFIQNSAVITSSTFSNTKITSDNPGLISTCSFTSGGTGHAIEITTPGTYTFTTNTFSGYGANATTDACLYNNSGGLVTINLGNYGDQVPTVRNGAGASTVVNNKLNTVSITGIIAGSRLQIYNVTTATEIVNTIVAGTTYAATYTEGVGYTSGNTLRIRLASQSGATAYRPYTALVIAGATGWSALASQAVDAVYNSNAIDGSTVTECAPDGANVEIDVTDTDNITTLSRIYAWFIYNLMSSTGISTFFGGMSATDAANYLVDGTVVDLAFDNKKSNLLTVTGGFIQKSGGARGLASATTTGAIYFDSGRAYLADSTAIKAKTDLIPSAPAAVGSAMTLTTGERDAVAEALLDLTNGIETGYTLRQAMRIATAVLGGRVSGGPDTPTFRNLGNTADRVLAVADKDGNRTSVTLTP